MKNASTDIGKAPNYVGFLVGQVIRGNQSNSSTVNYIPNDTTLNSNSNTLGYGNSVWKADTNMVNAGAPILNWENR